MDSAEISKNLFYWLSSGSNRLYKMRSLNFLFREHREINKCNVVRERNPQTRGIVAFSGSSIKYLEEPMRELIVFFVLGCLSLHQNNI